MTFDDLLHRNAASRKKCSGISRVALVAKRHHLHGDAVAVTRLLRECDLICRDDLALVQRLATKAQA